MTLEKFNKLYLGKAVRCKTEELANEFLKLADSFDYTWATGDKLTRFNGWEFYKDKTCYVFNSDKLVLYGHIDDTNLKIIKFKGERR